jgi:RNA polymerase sigma factor (sigma-70 family)
MTTSGADADDAAARAPADATVIELSWHEPEQFALLFDRHAPRIQRYVVRRLGLDAADDIVAETFLLAFQHRESYDLARDDALPWLYGIATNLIRRRHRQEVRLYRALARTGADPVTAPFTDQVEHRVTAAAASRRLAAGLAKLPAQHRDALLLVAWGDLSYQETASALGIPVGTVRSSLNRARNKLKRALGSDPATIDEEYDHG